MSSFSVPFNVPAGILGSDSDGPIGLSLNVSTSGSVSIFEPSSLLLLAGALLGCMGARPRFPRCSRASVASKTALTIAASIGRIELSPAPAGGS
jgi:hypothetical protein